MLFAATTGKFDLRINLILTVLNNLRNNPLIGDKTAINVLVALFLRYSEESKNKEYIKELSQNEIVVQALNRIKSQSLIFGGVVTFYSDGWNEKRFAQFVKALAFFILQKPIADMHKIINGNMEKLTALQNLQAFAL